MVIVPDEQKKADGQARTGRRCRRKAAAICAKLVYFRMSFLTKLTSGPTT